MLLCYAAGAASAPPALSPDALKRAFEQIGLRVGVIRTIEGRTVRLDAIDVKADGKWIVVRMLPKRVAAQPDSRGW